MPRRPPMPHYDSGHMAEVMAAPPLLVGVPSIYGGGWEWEQMYAGPPRHLDDAVGDPSTTSSRRDRPHQSVPSQRGSKSRQTRPQPSLGTTPETLSVSLASKHELPPLPPHPQRPKYVEPEWVVHTAPTRPPLTRETKAERTSRHLRESSERSGRGRSVSPPLPPIPSDSSNPTVGPSDPARPAVLNIKPLGPRPRLSAPLQIEQKQKHDPSLLSPAPRPLVGYLNDPPSPHRLSPATVRSLEALVDDDQLYTLVDRLSHADLDKDEEADSSSALALAQGQRGDRRDVRDVWEPLVGIRPPLPSTPVVQTARIGSSQVSAAPKGSARGGRGGRVTSAKQIWLDFAAENERIHSPQTSTSTSSPSGAKSRSVSSTSTSTTGVYAQPRPSGMAQTRLKALIDKYDTAA